MNAQSIRSRTGTAGLDGVVMVTYYRPPGGSMLQSCSVIGGSTLELLNGVAYTIHQVHHMSKVTTKMIHNADIGQESL